MGVKGNVQWQEGIVLLSLGITQVNLTLIVDAYRLASVFCIPQNIIFYLREHEAKHRLSSEITEASLDFNFYEGVSRV